MKILENIRRWIFHYECRHNRVALDAARRPAFVAYKDVNHVLILCESEWSEQNRHAEAMIKALEGDGKKVTMCYYVPKKQSLMSTLPSRIVIDYEHINHFFKPEELAMRQLREIHYDVLIDVTPHTNLPLLYSLLYANASMKCGRCGDYSELFDMTISVEAPVEVSAEAPQEGDEKPNSKTAPKAMDNTLERESLELFNHILRYLRSFS